jgi:hypothetical protein
MNLKLPRLTKPPVRWGLCVLVLMSAAFGAWGWAQSQTPAPEIALKIGEPWEDMRKRSTAEISPVIPDEIWFRMPKTHARLRFVDDQYGFVTPPARFFTVNFNSKGQVEGIRMSPQVEPLLMDDAMKVVQDLQNQWRQAGWKTLGKPIEDTPELRQRLKQFATPAAGSDWQAGDKVQVTLFFHRFKDDRHPEQERYLITLTLAAPWIKPCSVSDVPCE